MDKKFLALAKKDKSGIFNTTLFISIIFMITVLMMAIWWWTGFGIPKFFERLLPGFLEDEPKTFVDYGFECPYLIAKIGEDGYLNICKDHKNCDQTEESKLYLDNNKIYAVIPGTLYDSKKEIGRVYSDTFVLIEGAILDGNGDREYAKLFYNLNGENLLPSHEDLLLLHDSYFLTSAYKEICRNELTTPEKERIKTYDTVKEVVVNGVTFYYDQDELIRNYKDSTTPLYLSSSLTQIANSELTIEGEVLRNPEEGESFEPQTIDRNLIPTSPEDKENYFTPFLGQNLEEGYFNLRAKIPNMNNELGVYTDSDDLDQVKYKKRDKRIYIRFRDVDGPWFKEYETKWVLQEYWAAYRSFARLPSWAKLT